MNNKKNFSSINSQISKFRDFMNVVWSNIDSLMDAHDWESDGYFIDDWLDFNWQLLVGRELLGKHHLLLPLSIPYDLGKNSADITKVFAVVIKLNNNSLILNNNNPVIDQNQYLRFFGFVSRKDPIGFGLYPPFDVACLVQDSTKKNFFVPYENLYFELINLDQYLNEISHSKFR